MVATTGQIALSQRARTARHPPACRHYSPVNTAQTDQFIE
jgi:hypothetical protein